MRSTVLLTLLLIGCDEQLENETVETAEEADPGAASKTKGSVGAVNGATDYCNDPANPCLDGEGDCDSDAQCSAGICATDIGARYGFGNLYDVCQDLTCDDGIKNGAELGVDCGPPCALCAPQLVRIDDWGGAGVDTVAAMAVDPRDGSLVVVGTFRGTSNFGTGNLVSVGAAIEDVWVAKYAIDGTPQWSKRFGGGLADGTSGLAVAVSSAGVVQVVGSFQGTVNFGGGNLVANGVDGFALQLDSAGNFVWAKQYGGALTQVLKDVAFDRTGAVVVAGYYAGTVSFGGAVLTSAGGNDVAVAKLDGAGNHVWSVTFGSTGADEARAVAVDADKSVYVGGVFAGTVPFGASSLVSKGLQDGLLVKLKGLDGSVKWSKGVGGVADDAVLDVAVDNVRRPVITGSYKAAADFGAGNVAFGGLSDAFTAAYGSGGAYRWARTLGGTGTEQGTGLAMDPVTGDVAVTGQLALTVPAFYATGAAAISAGKADTYVIRYQGVDGGQSLAGRFGGVQADIGTAAAYHKGYLYAAGTYGTAITIDGFALPFLGGTSDVYVGWFGF